MTLRLLRSSVSVLFVTLASVAWADHLEVRRNATLKAEATSESKTRQHLDPRSLLLLLDDGEQRNGYYHAKQVSGAEGWVYRTLVRRHPGDIGVAESAATATATAAAAASADMVFMGVPRSMKSESQFEVLENIGYVVGYSEERKDPIWAEFRLFPVDNPPVHPRPSRFRIDDRTSARVSHDCYTNNGLGYDRGHMAPNQAIDSRFGREGQLGTFLMSNVAPQQCGLNREPWEALEKVIANAYAQTTEDLYVVTGPIFAERPERIACDVEIPEAFFKVVVENQTGDKPRVLPVVMAQEDSGRSHKLRDFVTTVDCIESLTGLDLFPDLPPSVANEVEARLPDSDWDLDQVLVPGAVCPGITAADVKKGNERRKALLSKCAH